MSAPGQRAALRYALLAIGLGDVYYGRPKAGWKSQVARRLGIEVSYLSRIMKGERTSIGLNTIETAVQLVPIAREWFTLPDGEVKPDWREYVTAGARGFDPKSAEVTPGHLRMRAVRGRFLAWPGAWGRWVGYRQVRSPRPDMVSMEGRSIVPCGITEVPDQPYFRAALERGEIERVA